MKRILLISVVAMMTITSYARKHVAENAVVVADTIYYAADKTTVNNNDQASYYRLLMKQNHGVTQRDVFQDFYMDGTLKAEGEYSFIEQHTTLMVKRNGMVNTCKASAKVTLLFTCVKAELLLFSSKTESLYMTISPSLMRMEQWKSVQSQN